MTTKVVTTKFTDYQSKSRPKYQTTKRFYYQETTTNGANDQKRATNIPATVFKGCCFSRLSTNPCGQRSFCCGVISKTPPRPKRLLRGPMKSAEKSTSPGPRCWLISCRTRPRVGSDSRESSRKLRPKLPRSKRPSTP